MYIKEASYQHLITDNRPFQIKVGLFHKCHSTQKGGNYVTNVTCIKNIYEMKLEVLLYLQVCTKLSSLI